MTEREILIKRSEVGRLHSSLGGLHWNLGTTNCSCDLAQEYRELTRLLYNTRKEKRTQNLSKLSVRAEHWAAINCDCNTSALTVFARIELQSAAYKVESMLDASKEEIVAELRRLAE